MSNNPKVIGEGSFGCVHRPALKCKYKPYNPNPNKVSKLLTKENADDELTEFELIKKADQKEVFHLGKPGSCEPDNVVKNRGPINNCRNFDSKDINNYKLLLLKHGGKDLENIEEKYGDLAENNQNTRKVEQLFLNMSRILYGTKILIDKDIVHHDLKQQNIVYNEETGIVNFIDFGLMTTKRKMINEVKKGYPYGVHWSFPPEIILYDKSIYNNLCNLTEKAKKNRINTLYLRYKAKVWFTMQMYTYDQDDESKGKHATRNMRIFYIMCDDLIKKDYEKFLTKSMETFDNYGVGISLLSLVIRTKRFLSKRLATDLKDLFQSMIHGNVFVRPSPTEVVNTYEHILKSHKLLEKFNMRFENHFLVDGTIKEQEKKEIPKLVQNTIDKLIIKCPIGKERNPLTTRCVKNCNKGFIRDEKFKCKKDKTLKKKEKSAKNKTQKECPEGKELNPKTNRCINECKSGYSRDADFKCKPIHKLILEGHRQNPLRDV